MPSSPAAGWIQTFSKTGLPRHPAIGHAVQRDAAGDAEIFGAGRFAQPAGAGEQHVFGVVLHPPGEILPMPHRRAGFPFLAAVDDVGLLELRGPVRNVQGAVGELEQVPDLLLPAVGRQPHQFAALVPVAEDVGRGPAVERAKARHVVEFVAQEAAIGLHPDLLQAFELRAGELVIALGLAGERRGGVGRRIRTPSRRTR